MIDETDKKLAHLFAAHVEDLDSAAFTMQLSRRIAHRRSLERLVDFGLVIAVGLAAATFTPFMLDGAAAIIKGSQFLINTTASLAVTPFAWLGAGIVGLFTITWVRL